MSITAMKQALEALEVCEQSNYGRNWVWPDTAHPTAMSNVKEAITAIREVLAQQEQEPVATVTSESGHPDVTMSWWHEPALPVGTPLYTTPPQRTWVGLTDEEVITMSRYDLEYAALIGEVERKLKEKNT